MSALMCVCVNEQGDEEESGRFNNFILSHIGAKVREHVPKGQKLKVTSQRKPVPVKRIKELCLRLTVISHSLTLPLSTTVRLTPSLQSTNKVNMTRIGRGNTLGCIQ